MAESQPRQNYHPECEALVNKQINMELYASYVYLSMAYYFDRDDVALPGFFEFFQKCSAEETEHATKLMRYQNMRGGRVILEPIQKPACDDWESGMKAIQVSLDLEKEVNASLLHIHDVALGHGDAQFAQFLRVEYLNEQVRAISELSEYITTLKRAGRGLGEYLFDKETFGSTNPTQD